MYDFNPNFGLLAKFTPDPDSFDSRALANKGVACRWINQTSGDTVDVAVSRPGPTSFDAAKGAASTGTPVTGIGDAAYFTTRGNAGTVQVFNGSFWITVTSVYFATSKDAQKIVADAVAAAH